MTTEQTIEILLNMMQGYATFSQRTAMGKAIQALKQPVQKKGVWIDMGYGYVCNQCWHTENHHKKFCSNCGANMEEKQ